MTKSLNIYRPVRFTGGLYALTLVSLVAALALIAAFHQPLHALPPHLLKWMGNHVYLEVVQAYTYIVGLIILVCIHTYIHTHKDKYKLLNNRELAEEVDSSCGDEEDNNDQIERRLEQPRYVTTTAQQVHQRITAHHNLPAFSRASNEVNFYVRIGILIFGTGCMTHGAFKLAHLQDGNSVSLSCINLCEVIVIGLAITFTFFQAFFLFKNHKIVICSKRNAFKRGFAHLMATNACSLITTVIKEAQNGAFPIAKGYNDTALFNATKSTTVNTTVTGVVENSWTLSNSTCEQVWRLTNKASFFLYPCSVQYFVISLFVLLKLYHQVGSRWPRVECVKVEWVDPKKEIEFVIDDNEEDEEKRDDDTVVVDDGSASNKDKNEKKITIVDCDKAHKGLFAGLLVVVFTFIMIVCFFVHIRSLRKSSDVHMQLRASYFFYSLEYTLLLFSLLGTLVAMCRFKRLGVLKMRGKKFFNTEKSLLVLSYPWVVVLQTFYVVATVYGLLQSHLSTPSGQHFPLGVQEIMGIMTLCSCLVLLLNVFTQTCFIIDAFKRVTSTYQQKREKPGRAVLTFLIFCNLALFIVAVFEHERIHYNLMRSTLFEGAFWNVMVRLLLPFHILFRFISMASLTAVWKTTYTVSSYL